MNKNSIILFQFLIIIVGVLSLFILMRFPMIEGRAINLSLYEIYTDPFIIYGYLTSFFYFTGLYQGYKLLKQVGNKAFSSISTAKIVNKIKYCSYLLGLLITIGAIYIRFLNNTEDDPAGFLSISMIMTVIFITIGTKALFLERSIRKKIS